MLKPIIASSTADGNKPIICWVTPEADEAIRNALGKGK